MNTVSFLEWLKNEKSMSVRSAKDVVSRCGRVIRMLGTEEINSDTGHLLVENKGFLSSSMFIKSQLKRAVSLYLEFSVEQEKS
jgi:hypothetical protein